MGFLEEITKYLEPSELMYRRRDKRPKTNLVKDHTDKNGQRNPEEDVMRWHGGFGAV